MSEEMLVEALKASNPEAYVQELERGRWVIDGEFSLAEVAARLSEMLQKRPA